MSAIRGVFGSVVVVPAVVLLFGSAWQWHGLVFVHAWCVPILWGSMGALVAARSRLRLADRLLAAWSRADLVLASALVYAVVFRPPTGLGIALVTIPPVVALVYVARRSPALTTVYAAILWVFLAWLIPGAVTARIVSRIARVHELSVDHRLVPDGDEINSDGIRFRGDDDELAADDFVVLFLGDSFTYGLHLDYADAYPYAFETLLADGSCRETVRAVNFGWTSSSPLLSLRLLREIGYRYRPDLVIYNLDMTDFHDDLRYEQQLRNEGDFQIAWPRVINAALEPWWPGEPLDVRGIFQIFRQAPSGAVPEEISEVPEKRFFPMLEPLVRTRADLARGVMRNLAALHEFSHDVLGSDFAVVIYPRAFQYSRRESLHNWEEDKVERMGPYALEPFRYFDEVEKDLPYPVVSLLPAFQGSERFPLFLNNDPHWTRFGAALAAEEVARELTALDLLPCQLSRSST